MNREEAIYFANCLKNNYTVDLNDMEAFCDMAIKALAQEPTAKNDLGVDAVSRQAVLYLIADDDLSMGQVVKGIHALPSVTPQEPRWIPVSERLPKKSDKYWCTFGGTYLTGTDFYTTKDDAEIDFDESEEYVGWRSQNVIAWMPLPTSYREVDK